ncbi:MAG: ATP-binding protein [Lachnospiraceae bacterium]|nr:ATP-binding protein [Lachnospiraceae bacterium]
MEIKRDTYLNKLIRREQNSLIKIVTGVRRCGKSYLLFHLFHQYLLDKGVKEDHIIEVALDDMKHRALRNPEKMFSYVEDRIKDDSLYYIILDEVQLLDDFVDVLNGFLHIKNADVYVTGSNSRFLSKDVVTEFRGRGDEIRMLPLSFREFTSVYNGTPSEAWDDYFNYGGLPLVLTWQEPEEKEAYLLSLFKEVYLADIIERHKIRNHEEFNELLDILASSTGSLTNPLKLSKTFKSVKNKTISDITISRYIEYLEDAFLISRAVRYDVKGRKYIGSPAKYYFEDVGLRNARLNFRQTEENHIMENIIYNELRCRDFRVDVGVIECSDRSDTGKLQKKQYEIDFIAAKGNLKFYIQSAFRMDTPEKIEQETRSLRQIPDSFKKIIVVKEDKKPRYDEYGFVTIGIRQFLMDETILMG